MAAPLGGHHITHIALKLGHEPVAASSLKTSVHSGRVFVVAECGRRYCMTIEDWQILSKKIKRQLKAVKFAEEPQ